MQMLSGLQVVDTLERFCAPTMFLLSRVVGDMSKLLPQQLLFQMVLNSPEMNSINFFKYVAANKSVPKCLLGNSLIIKDGESQYQTK